MDNHFVSCISSGGACFALYLEIVNGRGTWTARAIIDGQETGEPFPISYEQARGIEPIRPTAVDYLARKLGRLLLPEK